MCNFHYGKHLSNYLQDQEYKSEHIPQDLYSRLRLPIGLTMKIVKKIKNKIDLRSKQVSNVA